MSMTQRGMPKLVEECCELGTVVAKKIAYPEGIYPDGNGRLLDQRIEDEMGDVLASIQYVTEKLGLSDNDIQTRATLKYRTLKRYETEP